VFQVQKSFEVNASFTRFWKHAERSPLCGGIVRTIFGALRCRRKHGYLPFPHAATDSQRSGRACGGPFCCRAKILRALKTKIRSPKIPVPRNLENLNFALTARFAMGLARAGEDAVRT